MASLKEIRIRINSVSSTKQITSAMKMVSAAKLRKAQDAILQLRPYAIKMQEILSNVSGNLDSTEQFDYSKVRELKNVLIVVITSNRGLCGAFNSTVIRKSIHLYEEYKQKGINVSFLAIGKKGRDFFKAKKYKLADSNIEIFDSLTFNNASLISNDLIVQFLKNNYDKIEIVFNQFRNTAVQDLIVEQFLPVVPAEKKVCHKCDYIFEPNVEYIVTELIPKSLRTNFFKALLDSVASEHGARMTAMHKATDNATDLLRDLKLQYNNARQAAITNEILEIVSGAEALRG